MTEEVLFALNVWLIDTFPLRNSTQFSGGGEERGNCYKKAAQELRTCSAAHSVTCVPCIVARRPGQLPREGEVKVENPPGQNNDVIEV